MVAEVVGWLVGWLVAEIVVSCWLVAGIVLLVVC